jgi:hypothetical protein
MYFCLGFNENKKWVWKNTFCSVYIPLFF